MIARIRDSRIDRIGPRVARGSVISAIEYLTTFGYGGSPGNPDDFGWPPIGGNCRLDWRGDDGAAPTVGPALSVGSSLPIVQKSPFYAPDGTNLPAAYFDSTKYLYDPAAPILPTDTEDLVLITLATRLANTNKCVLGLGSGGNYIHILQYSSVLFSQSNDGVSTNLFTTNFPCGWAIMLHVLDRGAGEIRSYGNGGASSGNPGPEKFFAQTGQVAIGATSTAASKWHGLIARALIYTGVGIAAGIDATFAGHLSALIYGIVPNDSARNVRYSRNGHLVSHTSDGVFSLGYKAPPIHDTDGIYLPESSITKAYKNANLVAGDSAILSATGGMVISDVALDLTTYGLYGISDRVFQAANSTGSTQYVYYGATVGAAQNDHSCSVRAHHTAGTGAKVGCYCAAAFNSAANVSDNFVRSHGIVSPLTAIKQWAIEIPDGATVQFILPNFVERDFQSPEVINQATAATATAGNPAVMHGYNLSDIKGLLEAEIAPEGWSAGEEASSEGVFTAIGGGGQHMLMRNGLQVVSIKDGTNEAKVAIAEVDGVYQIPQVSWGPKGLQAKLGALSDSDPYDGTIGQGEATTEESNRRIRYTKMAETEI